MQTNKAFCYVHQRLQQEALSLVLVILRLRFSATNFEDVFHIIEVKLVSIVYLATDAMSEVDKSLLSISKSCLIEVKHLFNKSAVLLLSSGSSV